MATLTKNFQRIGIGSSVQFGYATGYLELWAKYNSQDIAKNTTNYTVELRLVVSGGDIGNYQATNYSLSATGLTTSSGNLGGGDYTSRTLASITGNVVHDDKGEKSISSSGAFNPTAWGYGLSVSGSATLPKIPRVSDVVVDKENAIIGEVLSITTTKKYSEFIDNLTIKFGEFTKVIENVNGIYEWNTLEDAEELYEQMPTTTSLMGEITVETFSEGTSIGTNSVDFTLNVVDANPEFTNFTYEDRNPRTLGLTGNNQTIVKNYSNVKGLVSLANKASAINGATMKKYRFVVGEKQKEFNYSESEDVSATIDQVQNNVFVIYAIDSRNNSTMKQINAETYLDYFKPKILNFSLERTLGGVGEYVVLNVNGEFWDNSFGTETNGIVVTYKIKRTDSEEWIVGKSDIIPQIDGNNFNFSGEVAGDLENTGFDIESSYNIEITITDKLDSAKDTEIIGSGTPNMAMHKNGTAFGGIYDELAGGLLQVAGEKTAEKVEEELKIFANYSLTNGKRLLNEDDLGIAGIGEADVYSYDEVKTNKVWVNGKPIYRKVLNIGSYSFVSGENTFEHNITDFETLIDIKIRNTWVGNGRQYLWWGDYKNITMDTSKIYVSTASGSSFVNMFIIIEYTKTID